MHADGRVGAADASLTGSAGVAALAELSIVWMVGVVDEHLEPIEARDQGVSAGRLLVGHCPSPSCWVGTPPVSIWPARRRRRATAAEVDFAIEAKRNTAMSRALRRHLRHGQAAALGMPGAQVAACDQAPAGWPPDANTIVRRVCVDACDMSAHPRSRRRTSRADQLALALGGTAEHADAASLIVINILAYRDAADYPDSRRPHPRSQTRRLGSKSSTNRAHRRRACAGAYVTTQGTACERPRRGCPRLQR